jgi:hypothetical protein
MKVVPRTSVVLLLALNTTLLALQSSGFQPSRPLPPWAGGGPGR